MNRLRLSTDILSPIHSDISLNDASVHSSTSLIGTPKNTKSSEITRNRFGEIEKDLGFSSCYKNPVEKDATAGQITNDSKKQSYTNAAKEDLEQSCDQLTQSMDELFYNQPPFLSVITPLLKHSKNSSNSLSDDSSLKDIDNKDIGKPPILSAVKSSVSILPDQKNKYSSKSSKINKVKVTDKVNSQQLKKAHSTKESIKKIGATSNKLESDSLPIKSYNSKHSKMKSSSTQTCNSITVFDSSEPLKNSKNKNDGKIKNLQGTSGSTPFAENKDILTDKRSQIFMSMELDNIRNFMLDQNIILHKELLILKEMIKKQNQVTEYLLSAYGEVVETNRKLISKTEKS